MKEKDSLLIPEKQLDIFIELYEKKFGITPTREVTIREAMNLLSLVKIAISGEKL